MSIMGVDTLHPATCFGSSESTAHGQEGPYMRVEGGKWIVGIESAPSKVGSFHGILCHSLEQF
jgi:hypothetical protein